MKIEHIAIACKNKAESDRFFINLLGLSEKRKFTVPADLMKSFFGVKEEKIVVRYGNDFFDVEVFLTEDDSRALDIFTHLCLIIEDRDKIVNDGMKMGYEVAKVPRKDSENYYLFIKDSFGNLYEIKSP
ncbi:MAG: VOC family protein [Candidatus Thorarchaeota archaeon]